MIYAKDLRLHNFVGCKVSNDNGVYQVEALGGYKRIFYSKEYERIYNLSLDEQIKCKKTSIWHDERLVKLNGNRSGESYIESKIKGVKLTEEWLLKFGFNKKDISELPFDELIYEKGNIQINDEMEFYNGIFTQKIKYVHQLQNLYFALTGEELL